MNEHVETPHSLLLEGFFRKHGEDLISVSYEDEITFLETGERSVDTAFFLPQQLDLLIERGRTSVEIDGLWVVRCYSDLTLVYTTPPTEFREEGNTLLLTTDYYHDGYYSTRKIILRACPVLTETQEEEKK